MPGIQIKDNVTNSKFMRAIKYNKFAERGAHQLIFFPSQMLL